VDLITMADCWDDLSASFPKDMPRLLRYQLRQSFFTGAWALHLLAKEIAEAQDKKKARERFNVLCAELESTVGELDELAEAHYESASNPKKPH
jgi:hypothetical protein